MYSNVYLIGASKDPVYVESYDCEKNQDNDWDYFKIGVSCCPEDRREKMQGGSPLYLEVIDIITTNRNMAYRLESILHRRLRGLRVHGEWFLANHKVFMAFTEVAEEHHVEEIH